MSTTELASSASSVDLDELKALGTGFETASAGRVISWAAERFGGGLVMTASFQDAVLIDVATSVVPDIEVVFLDTQYHFPQTLAYVQQVRDRYDLELTVMTPEVLADDRWRVDLDGCCAVRKVEPLNRALAGRHAWMTGLRRDDSPARAATPIVHWDLRRDLVKINPIATWTDLDVAGYVADHDVPVHPLAGSGYPSIGCWPCTRSVDEGEDARAGRWKGFAKTECGLHSA